MEHNPKDFIWAQKYRPKKVDDCILPSATMSMVKGMLEKNEIPHLLFCGGPGMGKTTLAYAIADELGSDVLYINASLENGIDILRTKIQGFASSMSLSDTGPKIVILDEAEGTTPVMQNALKGFLEAFSSNCRFVFTTNNKHKIIEPILSRCTVVDFSITAKEKTKVAGKFFKRVEQILKTEQIEYDQKVVAKLVANNFPDFRKTLNVLQRYSSVGVIDSGILVDQNEDLFVELVGYLKDTNFTEVRKWVARNEDTDVANMFRSVYNIAVKEMEQTSIPNLVLILADYGHRSAFCVDQQINTTACMVEIMTNCKWS